MTRDAVGGAHGFLDALCNRIGAVDRCTFGQDDLAEDGALVFGGKEAGRGRLEQPARAGDDDRQSHDPDGGDADEPLDDRRIAVAGEVDALRTYRMGPRLGPWRALSRMAQRAGERVRGVDGRDDHRHRHGHRELAEEFARNAGDEGDRHEDREEHQRDRDDRCGDLPHGAARGFRRRDGRILFEMVLDRLYHDDGVVDHDADRQHEGEERYGIGRETERQHRRESTDERDRHGDQRNEGGGRCRGRDTRR